MEKKLGLFTMEEIEAVEVDVREEEGTVNQTLPGYYRAIGQVMIGTGCAILAATAWGA